MASTGLLSNSRPLVVHSKTDLGRPSPQPAGLASPPAPCVGAPHSPRGRPDVSRSALALEAPLSWRTTEPDVGPQLGWPCSLQQDFALGKSLGTGTFGSVHAATHKSSGIADFAVKVLRKGGPRTRVAERLARVQREADILDALRGCSQVARLVAKYETSRFVYFVLERAYGPSMMEVMRDPSRLSEGQVCCLIHECLEVLKACHSQRILHGDVKAANFMMARPLSDVPVCDVRSQSPVLKAVDFGCSRYLAPGEHLRELVGSPAYTAPEVHLEHFELPSDMWSLGMTFFQLVTGALPFWPDYRMLERSSWEQLTRAVLMEEVVYDHPRWAALSPAARDLCGRMLDRDPATRVTAADAVQHEWFDMWACKPASVGAVWASNVLPLHPAGGVPVAA